ncbi:MAG: hydrolase [Candidatus Paceibacterota bacterium]|jgi:nicotinamidase-related amidase
MNKLFDKNKTALVIIDLQKGIINRQTYPRKSSVVVSNATKLADVFRENSMPVFLIRVTASPDMKDGLKPITDSPTGTENKKDPDWADIVSELVPKEDDFVITKRQWGAFYNTELDLQLRRRKIETIVLCGISTNIGVESTARFAYEYGYQQIFVEDAMASGKSKEEHEATIKYIFPRIGRVRKTDEIINEFK